MPDRNEKRLDSWFIFGVVLVITAVIGFVLAVIGLMDWVTTAAVFGGSG